MKILNNLPNPTAPTAARPDGALKDVSAPAAGDGTPAREDWLNDAYYALLAVMDTVGVSADDSDEEFEAGVGSQFLDAMRLFTQEWAYPGLDFGLKNISAGNQSSDITIYETGGGSEKEDGFTVRLRWTGGDASFNHTITSAYTIGNELSGFLTSSRWVGEGAGELVLRLDKTNSKWLILSPGIWDKGNNSDGSWEKNVNGKLFAYDDDVSIANPNSTLNLPVTFNVAPVIESMTQSPTLLGYADTITTTTLRALARDSTDGTATTSTTYYYRAIGVF